MKTPILAGADDTSKMDPENKKIAHEVAQSIVAMGKALELKTTIDRPSYAIGFYLGASLIAGANGNMVLMDHFSNMAIRTTETKNMFAALFKPKTEAEHESRNFETVH